MAVAYEKETGKRVWFSFEIDRRQAIEAGTHTNEPSEDSKSEDDVELDGVQIQKVAGIAERARLGEVLSPEEREALNEFQTNAELDAPGSPPGVPAPEPVLVADVFNPATASRAELFGYLRGNDVDVGNASSTEHLREEATKLFVRPSNPDTEAE